jgi:hypothetical protein
MVAMSLFCGISGYGHYGEFCCRGVVHGAYLILRSAAADAIQGNAVVHPMIADQPPAHHHPSSAMHEYSAVRIAIVSAYDKQRSDVKNIETCPKRINRNSDAHVVVPNLRYPLTLGK